MGGAERRSGGEATVSGVLSAEVVASRENDSVEDAANLVAQHQIPCLPVLGEDRKLPGILFLAEVARRNQDAGGATLDDISEPASNS